jgi:WD40 repeat protein
MAGREVARWRADGGAAIDRVTLSEDVLALAFAPDGRLAIGASGHVEIRAGGPEPVATAPFASAMTAVGMAWSPDGARLAVVAGGELIVLGGAAEPRRRDAHGGLSVAWSPDGAQLVVAGLEQAVLRFDAATLEPLAELKAPVSAIAFRPDGAVLATAGMDGVVRFWEPGQGRLLAEHGFGGMLLYLAFAGDRLIAAGLEGVPVSIAAGSYAGPAEVIDELVRCHARARLREGALVPADRDPGGCRALQERKLSSDRP